MGDNRYTGVVTAAYAEGSVSGRADRYGGLLGSNQGVVIFCFSTGAVPESGGGLIERNGNNGAVANCYWDTETSGQSDSAGGEGKTTAELRSPTGYTGAYADWNVDLDGDGTSGRPVGVRLGDRVSRSQFGDSRHRSWQSERQAPTGTKGERGIVLGGKQRTAWSGEGTN